MKSRDYRPAVFLLVSLLFQCDSGRSCLRETHTLHYKLTVVSPEDYWQPLLLILVYIDDELFLCYKGDSRRAEACGPRIKGHAGAETWTRETEDFQKKEEQLWRMLAGVTNYQGHNMGFHTLQETLGCELQGNRSTGSFWHFGYDGQDSLTFDQKTLTWTTVVPSTQQTKMVWETHVPRADGVKAFLEDVCPAQLQGYLAFLENFPLITGLPEVKVTSRRYPVGRITLTCWAFNLCLPVATLVWLQHGKPVQQFVFGPRTILPSGDGTYQTWVSIWILPGQEPEFTCHLRHQSHDIKVPAASGHGTEYFHDATGSARASAVSALPAVLLMMLTGAR
ncbi:hereditary hemochromatosis protein homolog isoform X1 [Mesocricetus auratus]|uniref:Hereditary hemochromatosis protein homolog isoform X1 n=1 Tax=Mesocricetus auratus TaxID=10036 RepID=A0A1U8CMW2_MESAU|nr:hereditary hemochromatosis protein homolog isoform X1 [Mesocricetus auratus]